ncbi:group I intron-associated PD-(D/E)XK endonuclease [Pseudogracilibacillus sp. SO30301A]
MYKEQTLKRVQVKYKGLNSKGSLEIRFRPSYCNTKDEVSKPVDKNEIDAYCVYCP